MTQVRDRVGIPWAFVMAAFLLPFAAGAGSATAAEAEVVEKKDREEPEDLFPAEEKESAAASEEIDTASKPQDVEEEKTDDTAAKEKDEEKKADDTVAKEKVASPQMQEYVGYGEPGMIPGEEVGMTVGPSSCRPAPSDYAVFDVLFLQRDDATNNQPFVIANDNAPNPGEFLMTSRSMTPSVAPGVRLMYGRRTTDCAGWEAGYFGVYGMYGDSLVADRNQLQVAGDLGENVPGFANASIAEGDYWSSLNSAELNVFRSNSHAACDPCARLACHRCYHCTTVDWLAGLRWASLEEQATLGVIGRAGDRPTPYTVNTSSNLLGLQVGVRGRTAWHRFAFEGAIKTAVAGATLYQSQSDIASPINGFVARTARSSSTGGVGMIADVNLAAIYRINRVWGLRAGYNLFWLSGVALAPSQFDFSLNADSGLGLDHGAGLFLNGGSLGLEARW